MARERPLVVAWESDTSGVKKGADEVIRTVEETEQRLDQVEQTNAQRRAARAEASAQALQDIFGVSTAQEFAQLAQQAAQTYVDAFIDAMDKQQGRIKAARDTMFAIYSEGGTPTQQDELTARITALGNGDYTAGLLAMQQRGLTAQDLLTASGTPGAAAGLAGAAADVGTGPLPAGLLGVLPGVAALSWLTGRAAESSGLAGDARIAEAVRGQQEALAAANTQTALLQQIATNTAGGGIGGGTIPAPGVPGVNGAAPSTSPAWSNPMMGAGGSAFVPTRG